MGIKMWIRSQDKKILTKIDDLDIDGANQIWGDCCLLGKYSSEQKALNVLDEIQERIEYPYPSKIMPSINTNCYHLIENNKFYQMPQDDEVEV